MGLTSCATGRKIISSLNRGIWLKASIAYIGRTASDPPPLCETNLHPISLTSSRHVVGHSILHLTSLSHTFGRRRVHLKVITICLCSHSEQLWAEAAVRLSLLLFSMIYYVLSDIMSPFPASSVPS